MQTTTLGDKYFIGSVKDAMRILKLYSSDGSELGVTEIARKVGKSKSTTYRLINDLNKKGYLEKNPRTNKYRLGLSVLRLSGVIETHRILLKEAKPVLDELTDHLGEASHLCELEGTYITYLYKANPEQPAPLLSKIGKRNPAFCTSAGKAMLAFLPSKMTDQILIQSLESYSFNQHKIKHQLNDISQNRYSVCINELHDGAISVGAPIFDYSDSVIAGLSVVGPNKRMQSKLPAIIQNVTKTSSYISEKMGYIG